MGQRPFAHGRFQARARRRASQRVAREHNLRDLRRHELDAHVAVPDCRKRVQDAGGEHALAACATFEPCAGFARARSITTLACSAKTGIGEADAS